MSCSEHAISRTNHSFNRAPKARALFLQQSDARVPSACG